MKELFNLGKLYVSDFLKSDEDPRHPPAELKLLMEDDGFIHIESRPPLHTMWGKYWYRSSISNTMVAELKSIVESITSLIKLKENDLWIDVASNDGTLLSFVPKNLIRVGVDPADDTFKIEAEKQANVIIQDYFTAKTFKKSKFGNLRAKVLSSIAVFYDLEKPEEFIKDVAEVLDDNGLWVLQLSYAGLMHKQLAFDNCMHEHWSYVTFKVLKNLFEKNGFQIVDCQLNDINGGSFRVYAMKQNADLTKFGTQPYRDVAKFRIDSLLEYEKTLKLDEVETWENFYKDILKLKEQVLTYVKQAKAEGKKIWIYGASSKGSVLCQFFGLDNTLIDGAAERSVAKWGLRTVGTNIPIYSEDEFRKANVDLAIVLPWHFISEFIEREKEFLDRGGKFLVPCPKFEIIGK